MLHTVRQGIFCVLACLPENVREVAKEGEYLSGKIRRCLDEPNQPLLVRYDRAHPRRCAGGGGGNDA